MREPRSRATQGLQGKIDGQLKRPVVLPLGPCKSGLPDLRRLTADLGQARDQCLAALARDTRDRRLANVSLAVVSPHDVKQRSVRRSRGAFRRPGLSLSLRTLPQRGAGG